MSKLHRVGVIGRAGIGWVGVALRATRRRAGDVLLLLL
jgi:hypothetical protein